MTEPVEELLAIAPNGASAVVALRTPYRVVSRLALSGWGLDRARAAGARFVSAAVERIERRGNLWHIVDSRGSEHRARRLVAADGATSPLRRRLAPGLKPELAPTRVSYTRRATPARRAVIAFLRAAQGYIWDFPRRDHDSLGIGVAPGTFHRGDLDAALEQFRRAEAGDRAIGTGAGAVIATSAWVSGRFDDLGGTDYALLGDAGGLADPVTGEGIDYALRSATLAATAFDPTTGFAAYPALARCTFQREIRRAHVIRDWLYHPAVANWLIGGARRGGRTAVLLAALCDAINEHGSMRRAFLCAAAAAPPSASRAAPCDCAASGGSAPRCRSVPAQPAALAIG